MLQVCLWDNTYISLNPAHNSQVQSDMPYKNQTMQSQLPQNEEPYRVTAPSQKLPVFNNTEISVHESGYNRRTTVHMSSTISYIEEQNQVGWIKRHKGTLKNP